MNASIRTAVLLAVLLVALTGLSTAAEETIPLTAGWRFQPGDNPAWAAPEFDDTAWVPIRVDKIWEDQGYEKLDGFAWFRLRFVLPARLKERAHLQDGVRICLGKINNFDQSFLNGALFGVNGKVVPASTPADTAFLKADSSLWNVERCYVLPPDDPRLRWDQENVLAVRVYDEGGQGGLWSGTANLRMVALSDYLDVDCARQPFTQSAGRVLKEFSVRNTSGAHPISGTLRIRAETPCDGKVVMEKLTPVDLKPGASMPLKVDLLEPSQTFVIHYDFALDGAGEAVSITEEVPYILTPLPPDAPRVNGPAVYGARPGRPFLFAVPASGERQSETSSSPSWLKEVRPM